MTAAQAAMAKDIAKSVDGYIHLVTDAIILIAQRLCPPDGI